MSRRGLDVGRLLGYVSRQIPLVASAARREAADEAASAFLRLRGR